MQNLCWLRNILQRLEVIDWEAWKLLVRHSACRTNQQEREKAKVGGQENLGTGANSRKEFWSPTVENFPGGLTEGDWTQVRRSVTRRCSLAGHSSSWTLRPRESQLSETEFFTPVLVE